MGDVLLASDLTLDRFVAIKVLRRELSTLLEIDARFRREARLLSRLNHPNVVVLYSFGSALPHLHFIVMEYVQGETLEARLSRSGTLEPMAVCQVMAQIGSAVADAHRKGIIHRDLKPSNVLLTSLAGSVNFVKVVDFGVAKVFGTDEKSPVRDATFTLGAGLIGTPAYMSPEQLTSENVDARSDIYALGIMACELLTGLSPFDKADSLPKLLEVRLVREPALPSRLRPDMGLPFGVDAVIQKALRRDPAERYQAVDQFIRELLQEIQTWSGAFATGDSGVGSLPVASRNISYDATIAGQGIQPSKLEPRAVRTGTVVHIEFMRDPYTSAVEMEEFLDCLELIAARLRQVFEVHRGALVEPFSDRVLVLFAPEAEVENDAERALDAALAVRSALDALSRDPTVPTSFQLACRMGIDSGRIMITQSQSGARIIQGPPLFESRRMAQAAPAGQVRISNAVYRKVRGLYDSDLSAEGAGDQPGRIVLSKKSTAHLGPSEIHGVRMALIGRGHEIEVLRAAFERAVQARTPHVVVLSGPSGIGKSRITAEFIKELEDSRGHRCYFELGRCTPAGQGLPYEPFIQAIRHRSRLSADDPPEEVRFKLDHYVRRFVAVDPTQLGDAEQELVRLLAELLGVPEGDGGVPTYPRRQEVTGEEARRKAMFDGLTLLYQRLASRQPLVFLLEDFEWATAPMKMLLSHVLTWIGDCPALFLVAVRTEGGALPDLSYIRDPSVVTSLPVGPLEPGAGEALARHMMRELIEVPSWLLRQITALAEGVPLIIEETVHDLIDDGVIVVEEGRWKLGSPTATSVHLPGTLEQLFLTRLERLEPHMREAVDAASVAGRRFWPSLLKELMEGSFEPRIMAELVRRGIFVERRDVMAQGEFDYGFAQAAIQEVAYRNIPRARRRALHRAAALWLDRWMRQAGAKHEDAIGHHFHEAGELSRALPYKQRAAQRAIRTHAIEDAVRLLESCREILMQIPAVELRDDLRNKQLLTLVASLVHQLVLSGNLNRAVALSDEVLPGSTASDREMAQEMARIAIWKGWALEHLGRYADARVSFVAAQKWLGAGGGLLALMALTGEMESMVHLGQKDDCAERLRRMAAVYEKTATSQEDERALSSAYRVLGNNELHLGRYEASEIDYRRAYDLALSANAPVEAVDALNCLAAMQYFQTKLDQAEATWRAALKQTEQWDLIQHRSVILSNLGELELARGDALQARTTLQHAEALHIHLGSDRGLAETHRALSECHLLLDEIDQAKSHAEQALERAERIRSPYMIGTAHRTLGRVLCALCKSRRTDPETLADARHHFDASVAAFDAAGMTKLAEETKALRDSLTS